MSYPQPRKLNTLPYSWLHEGRAFSRTSWLTSAFPRPTRRFGPITAQPQKLQTSQSEFEGSSPLQCGTTGSKIALPLDSSKYSGAPASKTWQIFSQKPIQSITTSLHEDLTCTTAMRRPRDQPMKTSLPKNLKLQEVSKQY